MDMSRLTDDELDRIIRGEDIESDAGSRQREKPAERGEGLGQVERAQLKRMAETGDESYGEGAMGAIRSIGEMVAPFAHGNMVRVNANRAKARQGFIDGSTYNDGYRKFGGDTSVDERFAGDEPKGTSFWADLTQGVSDQAEALPIVGGLLRKGREAFNGWAESSFFEHLVNEARQTGLSGDDIDEAIRQSKGDPRKFQNVFGRMVFEDERHADEVKKSAKRKLAANPEDWVDKIVQGFIANAGYTGEFFAGGVLAKGLKAGKLVKFAAQNAIPAASSAATRKAELEGDEYTFDENGNRVLVSKGDENALGKAVRGGIAEAAVETGTDAVVDWLLGRVPGVNALGKAVMRNLRKTEVGKAVANGLKTYRAYAGVTGVNGAPVEVLEEDVQGFIDNVMGWDRKDSEYEGASKEWTKFRNETLTAEGQLDTFLGLLGTMAVQGGAALHKAQYQLANDKRDTRTALKTALPGMEDAIDKYSGDQLRFLKHLLTKTETVGGVRDGSGRSARQTRYALNGDNIAKLFDRISSRYGERAREGMQQVVDDLMANDNTPQWVKGIDERADARFTIPQNGDGQVLWNVGEDGKKFMTDPRTGISVTEKFSDGDNVMYEISDGKGHFAGADSVQSAFDAANAMARFRATLEAQRDAKAQLLEGMKKGIGRGVNVVAADDMDLVTARHPELKNDVGFNPLNESVMLKDGTVVMVLDNIDTPMKMEQKLLHEAGVHMGLRLTHPKDKLDFIRQIAPKDANEMVKAVAKAYGTTADKVLKDPRLLEEVVAHTVERSMRSQGFRQKAVALARNAVRKAGIDVDYSDAEMSGIVESMVAATNEGDGSFTRWRGLTPDDREEAARLQAELDAEDPEAERRANAALGEAVQKGADEERAAGRKADFNAAVDEELENEEIAANMDEGEFAHPQRTAPDPVSREEAARNRERERRAKRIARANAAIGREARPNVPDPELEAEDAKKKVRITVGTDTSGENADYNGHTVNVKPYSSGGKEKGRIITLPDGSQLFAQGAKSTSDALKQMGSTLERRLPRETPKIPKSERKPSRDGTSVNWGSPDFVDWVRRTKKRNPRYEDLEEYENFKADEARRIEDEKAAKAHEKRKPTAAAEESLLKRKYVDHVQFANPLVGKTGAKLVAYSWNNKNEEYTDSRGEDRVRKVSDWEESLKNEDTNRDIVHHFYVVDENGNHHTVSLGTAAKMLGLSEGDVRREALAQMRKAVKLFAISDEQRKSVERVLKRKSSSFGSYGMPLYKDGDSVAIMGDGSIRIVGLRGKLDGVYDRWPWSIVSIGKDGRIEESRLATRPKANGFEISIEDVLTPVEANKDELGLGDKNEKVAIKPNATKQPKKSEQDEIADVGEKIAGARKDLIRDYAIEVKPETGAMWSFVGIGGAANLGVRADEAVRLERAGVKRREIWQRTGRIARLATDDEIDYITDAETRGEAALREALRTVSASIADREKHPPVKLPKFDAQKAGMSMRAHSKPSALKRTVRALEGAKFNIGGKEVSISKDDKGEYAQSGYSSWLYKLANLINVESVARKIENKIVATPTSTSAKDESITANVATVGSIANSASVGNSDFTGKARRIKAWAKMAWRAKVDAADNLAAVVSSAHNEKYQPYSEFANTPGHEKTSEHHRNLWGGGKYEYDVNFTTEDANGTPHTWNATLVVRADRDGNLFIYDLVNLDSGNAESAESRREYLRRAKKTATQGNGNAPGEVESAAVEAEIGNGVRFSNAQVIRSYNPDTRVNVVDGRNAPEFSNLTTSEIRLYLRDKYQGREVTIRSDGTVAEFTAKGLEAALKKRDKHRRTLHRLDALVENSHFTRYEENDGQKKHEHLKGQFVYTAALRLADGVYGVELKLDDPIESDKTRFKGQTLKTKIADAMLSASRVEDVELASDDETSAVETVRLGDFTNPKIPTAGIVPQSAAESKSTVDSQPSDEKVDDRAFTDDKIAKFLSKGKGVSEKDVLAMSVPAYKSGGGQHVFSGSSPSTGPRSSEPLPVGEASASGKMPQSAAKGNGAMWSAARVTPAEDAAYMDAAKRPDANERTMRLAPNGKRSNLSNALYHLVRTKRFKGWFGDWEQYVLGFATEFDCKAAVKNWRDTRKGFRNKANGRVAELKADWSKLFSAKAKGESDDYEAHYAAVMALDRLFENSVRMWGEKPRNGSQDVSEYAKYGQPFVFNGNVYLAKMTVKEYAAHVGIGDGFYSIEAVSVEKINATGNNGDISVKGRILDRDVGGIIAKRISECKAVSKVVDGNGEPLVVYHGSETFNPAGRTSESHAFDIGRAGSQTGIGFLGRGFYFTTDDAQANAYAGRPFGGGEGGFVTAAFVNLANPYLATRADFTDGYNHRDEEGWDEKRRNELKAQGFDGVVFAENKGVAYLERSEVVAFEPGQVKSADPVTHDDAGNVIPLARRFDPAKGDIRWSVAAGEDLSDPEKADVFVSALKAYEGSKPPARLRKSDPQSAYAWFKDNLLGKTFPLGGRSFTVKEGHFFRFVCEDPKDGRRKGWIDKATSPGESRRMIEGGEVSAEDIAGYVPARAASLPFALDVLTSPDAILRRPFNKTFKDTVIKKFNTGSKTSDLAVFILNDDGKTLGLETVHRRQITKGFVNGNNLIAISNEVVESRSPNPAGSRLSFADNAGDTSTNYTDSISNPAAGGNPKNPDIRWSVARTARLAPNGRRSNLSDALYDLVRTPAFKGWFGDWEALARRNAIDNAPAPTIKVGAFVRNEGESVQDAAKKYFNGSVKHRTVVGEVEIDARSGKDSLAHKYGKEKLDAITSIQRDFANAVYLGSERDFGGNDIDNHYFCYPIDYDGRRRLVFCRARQDVNKNRLYVHEVFLEDEIKSNALQTAAPANESQKPHGGIALYRSILQSVYAVNPASVSKVVDENGEPLVVYHGSGDYTPDGGFHVFATGGRNGSSGAGAFFTSNRSVAEQYAKDGKPYACFLNIRDPKTKDWNGELWSEATDEDALQEAEQEYIDRTGDEELLDFEPDYADYRISTDDFSRKARAEGRDGAAMYRVLDETDGDNTTNDADIYTVFSPSQVKSADPVTHDDAGNVIPLSQRFDADNADIRWSSASVEDEIRGISRDEINKWRAKVGLRPLEKPASVADAEVMRDAAGLMHNPDHVDTIIDAVAKTPRSLSEVETVAVAMRLRQAQDEYAVRCEQANAAVERGNNADAKRLRDEADAILSRADTIERALNRSGSIQGRAFRLRRVLLDRNLSLAGLVNEFQGLAGRRLTDEEREDVAEAYRAVRDALRGKDGAVLRELTKRIRASVLEEVERVAKGLPAELKGNPDVSAKVEGEFRDALRQFESWSGESGGILTGMRDAKKWLNAVMRMHVKSGVGQGHVGMAKYDAVMGATLATVRERLPGATMAEIEQAISGYGISRPLSLDETEAEIRDLNAQTRRYRELADLNAGRLPKTTGDERPTPSDELKRLDAEVRKRTAELKMSGDLPPEELQKLVERRLKELDRRLDRCRQLLLTDGLVPKGQRPPRISTPEIVAKEKEVAAAMRKVRERREHFRRENLPLNFKVGQNRILDYWEAFSSAPRILRTMLDLSATGAQGAALFVSHPIEGAKALAQSVLTFFSERKADELQAAFDSDPDWAEFQRFGGHAYAVSDAAAADTPEEFRLSDTVLKFGKREFSLDKLPGVKQSERSFAAFLNTLNLAMYKAMKNGGGWLDGAGPTDQQKRDLCAALNVASGYGYDRTGDGFWDRVVSSAFWAPRFMVAGFKQSVGYEVWSPLVRGQRNEKTWEERRNSAKQLAKEEARRLASMAAWTYLFTMLMGRDDPEWIDEVLDPRSTHFMNVRVGDSDISFVGPMKQWLTFMSRFVSGTNRRNGVPVKMSRTDAVGRLVRGKLSPLFGLGWDLSTGETYTGERIDWANPNPFAKGKDAEGKETVSGIGHFAESLGYPLSMSDVTEAFRQNGTANAMLLTPFAITGFAKNTFAIDDYKLVTDSYGKASREYDRLAKAGDRAGAAELKAEKPELKDKAKIDNLMKWVRFHENRAKKYADRGEPVPETLQRQIDEAKRRAIDAVRQARSR